MQQIWFVPFALFLYQIGLTSGHPRDFAFHLLVLRFFFFTGTKKVKTENEMPGV